MLFVVLLSIALYVAYIISAHDLFKDPSKKPVCDRYILNSYIYASSLIMIAMAVGLFTRGIFKSDSFFIAMGLLLAQFGFVLMLKQLESYVIQNIVAVIMAGVGGLIIGWLLSNLNFIDDKDIAIIFAQVAAIMVIIGAIAHQYKDKLGSKKFLNVIVIALLAFIIVEIPVLLLTRPSVKTLTFFNLIGLLFASLILAWKASTISLNADKCSDELGGNYPIEAGDLFYSFQDIFIQLFTLKKRV